jgi:hypothetical protein
MRRDLVVFGLVGLGLGVSINLGAGAVAARIPIMIQGRIGGVVVFAILLAFSLAEMPLMLFGLQQLARSQTTPRAMVVGTYTVYVTFASVYASLFVVLTNEFAWGLVLAALCVARFASGAMIR